MYFMCLTILVCLAAKTSHGIPIDGLVTTNNVEFIDKISPVISEEEVASLKEEIVGLKERLTALEEIVEAGLTNSDEEQGDDIEHENHRRSKRAIRFKNPEIAFQATLMKPSATVNMLETIIFNKVITNIGGAYKTHSGVFIAPVAGTYTFNTNIVSERGHYVEASIVRNGEVAVSAISDHRVPKHGNQFTNWDQGNAVAILRLNKGDKVSVTLQWPQGSHIIHGVGKSSFSGYLLRSHEPVRNNRPRYFFI